MNRLTRLSAAGLLAAGLLAIGYARTFAADESPPADVPTTQNATPMTAIARIHGAVRTRTSHRAPSRSSSSRTASARS